MIDVIGKMHELESAESGTPTITELEGFHVNSTEAIGGLEGFLIEPSSPRKTFFGVPTYFYKFADESEFDLAMNSPGQAEESQLEVAPDDEEIHNDQPAIDDSSENKDIIDFTDAPLAIDDGAIDSLEFEIFGDGDSHVSAELDLDEQ